MGAGNEQLLALELNDDEMEFQFELAAESKAFGENLSRSPEATILRRPPDCGALRLPKHFPIENHPRNALGEL